MKFRQNFVNGKIARKAIAILLNHGKNFEVDYDREDEFAPSIEITFYYSFRGECNPCRFAPVDVSDLQEIKSLITTD